MGNCMIVRKMGENDFYKFLTDNSKFNLAVNNHDAYTKAWTIKPREQGILIFIVSGGGTNISKKSSTGTVTYKILVESSSGSDNREHKSVVVAFDGGNEGGTLTIASSYNWNGTTYIFKKIDIK